MPRLIFTDAAEYDLDETLTYIARNNRSAAYKWMAGVRKKCRLLAKVPNIGEDVSYLKAGVRASVYGSYVIYFRQTAAGIEILRVIRGDRDVRSLD